MEKIKVLYVGDTQVNVTQSIKGIDSWTFTYYGDSAKYLRDALAASDDIVCTHIPSMNCIRDMPDTLEKLKAYDVIILSDVGYNNINLQPGNVQPFQIPMGPDRVQALYDYVLQGGGFMMVGGWLSFSGLQGKGLYGGTKIEEIMPVTCEPRGVDDRIEVTQGYSMHFDIPDHPILRGLPWDESYTLLGYNRVHLKEGATQVASWNNDVQIATWDIGMGRSTVFTCDVGPHWGGNMLQWSGYNEFWANLVRWTAQKLN